jgi:hypothetical protein
MDRLVIVGIACVLAAIVGGGFKGLGVEVPLIGSFRRQIILALAGVLLILTPVAASLYRQRYSSDPENDLILGLELYDSTSYQEALAHFRRASRTGLPAATYHYGEMLYHGEGVLPDKPKGVRLDRAAAEAGFAPAEAALAMAYLFGDQLPVDSQQARLWASRSAAQQDPVGQFINALVQPTPREGRTLLELSAEQGYGPAQNALANALLQAARTNELPVRSTMATAMIWAKRAADQGDPAAQVTLAYVFIGLGQGDHALKWLVIAHRAVAYPFQPLSDSVRTHTLRALDSLENALDASAVLATRVSALAWRARLERAYRHGH